MLFSFISKNIPALPKEMLQMGSHAELMFVFYKGSCIKGTVDLSLTPNPAYQYVYGELSAVTIGKILRMLGSKIDIPKKIADMGFPKSVVVSWLKK